jgi:5-methyltetrahydropteroyltriglutamate--homocysteine methyltransferase
MATTAPHNPPFRAEHIGSFLRPDSLLKAREEFAAGRITAAQLRTQEDEAIRQLVAYEEGLGLQSITDGEYRRQVFYADFYARGLGGIEMGHDPELDQAFFIDIQGHKIPIPQPTVSGRMRWTHPIHVDEFKLLRAATTRTPKMTLPSPTIIHLRAGRSHISRQVYPDIELFWSDIAEAFQKELKALAEAGCTYVQIDETTLCALNDPSGSERTRRRGEDPQKLLYEIYPQMINRALEGRPANMHVGMHLCRGNNLSAWTSEGGYDAFADLLFNRIKVDSYFLEYDTPRAGTFQPLKLVPKNKTVVLGLVSTKFPELESKDDLKRRIDEAARYIDLDQLCLSPQCGFASTLPGNLITHEQQTAKIKLVVEVAREVWG